MPSRLTAAFTLVATFAAVLTATAAVAAPATPTFDGPQVVAEAPDFATDRFGDPWDYANTLDQRVDNGPLLGAGTRGAFASDDRFVFHAPDGGMMAMVFPGFGGAYPAGRDGPRHPVNADHYTHIALRMRVPETNAGGILWHDCPAATNCQHFTSFFLHEGWHTFIVDLSASAGWAGRAYALRLMTGDVSGEGRYEIDWIRVYRQTADVTVNAPAGSTVYWDEDGDASNNTADSPGWGTVGTASSRGTVIFPASAYPGGTYRFYAGDSKGRSAHSAPLTIDERPRTVITDPDEQGGDDYITVTTGDAWDMSQPSDVSKLQNVTDVAWSGGQLHATNQPQAVNGGVIGNPIAELRMGPAIDTQRYHRLTVKTDYDGPFSLSFDCGGGMHGRLRWWHGNEMHVSRELVLYSDRHTYTWDLATDPATYINEDENYARDHGWRGATVNRLWWDANEDPCKRRWRLDDVQLRADDEAKGFFGVQFDDPAHDAGTTVSLYRDTDALGFNGAPIVTGLPQTSGANTYWWPTYGVPAGTWWLHVTATDASSSVKRYASGPVVTDGRPRVAGPDRVVTSVAASTLSFPTGAPAAVVALGHDFPDALAASAVAVAAGGPTLLNSRDALHPAVRAELLRLKVSTVYLMGGTAAQSSEVERALASMPGVTVERLGGLSRYTTAAAAATKAAALWQAGGDAGAGQHVLVALGDRFADALAASQLAGHARRPLLLVTHDTLPADTLTALRELGAKRVTIIGGPVAVSDRVRDALRREGLTVDRISGTDRYATAAHVADAATAAGADPRKITVAPGATFPDALGAGPAAVADGGVLLLTDGALLPGPTRSWLDNQPASATMVKVVGGPAVVRDTVVDAITAAAR